MNYPDLNTGWLLTGEGNMLKEDNKVNDNIVSAPVENADNDSFADYLKKQVAEKDKKIEEKDDEIKELYKKIERLNSYIAKLEVLLDVNSVDYQNIKRAV